MITKYILQMIYMNKQIDVDW